MADPDKSLEVDPVFSPVGLLPHHDDHPFLRHMHRDAHTERHRNTRDYVTASHSPITNRKNAGILLRRMSDDFNVRKFPELLEGAKRRPRSSSEGSALPTDGVEEESRAHARVYKFIRRLSSTAVSPTDTTTTLSKPPALPEVPNEEDESSE